MNRYWRKTIYLFELLRLELVLSAVSNGCFVVIFARQVEAGHHSTELLTKMSLPAALGLAAICSAGLTIYATCLNDILDIRRDKTLRRRRPIGSGQLSLRVAIAIALIGLLAALGAAVCFGRYSTLLAIVAALAILFYNTFARFIPAVGMVSLGLIRAMVMLIPCPFLGYVWPVCIAMGHMTTACTIAYLLAGRRPRMTPGQTAMTVLGILFWSLVLARSMVWRETLHVAAQPRLWLPVLASMVVFSGIALNLYLKSRKATPGDMRRNAKRLYELAMLWLIVYDACWLLGAGLYLAGAAHLGLFAGSWGLLRLIESLHTIVEKEAGYLIRESATQ